MKQQLLSAILEGLLEGLRVVALAAIPIVISGLEQGVVDWRLVGIAAAIAGLRFLDKALHEFGKLTSNQGLVKGLTRF